MNTSFILYKIKENMKTIAVLQTRKEKLNKKKIAISEKLKVKKCFSWRWLLRAIINIVTLGYINKNKQLNLEIKNLKCELETINKKINSTSKKIERFKRKKTFLKDNYWKDEKLKIDAINCEQNEISINDDQQSWAL